MAVIASWTLLVFGILVWWLCRNASRPGYRPFFLSPLIALVGAIISEFPKHAFMIATIGGLALALAGGAATWPGWIGLSFLGLGVSSLLPHWQASSAAATAAETFARENEITMPATPTAAPHTVADVGYGEARQQTLTVRSPGGTSDSLRPGFLYIHGGGWSIGSNRVQGQVLCRTLANHGFCTLNVNYRLTPRVHYPAHLHDIKAAIAWYREHALGLGADPDFLIVSGGSAGGHLAAMAALTAHDKTLQPGFEDVSTEVAACVPLFGVYDLTCDGDYLPTPALKTLVEIVLNERLGQRPDLFEAASPVHRIRPGAPPFFLLHGQLDNLVPVEMARLFVRRFKQITRQRVIYWELPLAHHGFDLLPSRRALAASRVIAGFCLDLHKKYLRKVSSQHRG